MNILAHFKFSIDDHPLDVVASDGVSLTPVQGVHQLPIGVGQRVSSNSSFASSQPSHML